MTRGAFLGSVALTVTALSGTAGASTISMTFNGVQGQGVHYDYSGTRGSATSGNTTAGRFNWTVTTGGTFNSHTFVAGDQFSTFCTELTQFISPGNNYSYDCTDPADMPTVGQLASPMGTFRAGLLQELFDNRFADARTGTTTDAAAFQVAVWEIVYEDAIDDGTTEDAGAADAGAGTFVVSSNLAAVTLANMWLDELDGDVPATENLIGFGSDANQDQVTLVPLPPPLLLAGVGLVGLAVGGRRLRKLAVG